jgi:predicted phage terminase large subunit-like protein
LTHQVLAIDPALTARDKSDFTAMVVVGYSASERRAVIRHVRAVRVAPGEALRALVLRILEQYPDVVGILIETNNGGDAWKAILHHMPVPVRTVFSKAAKEVRAADLLALYQKGHVLHETRLTALESQMFSFPKGANDDLIDAAGSGIAVFLGRKRKAGAATAGYV